MSNFLPLSVNRLRHAALRGVADPSRNLALIQSGRVATLLASNQPFSVADIEALNRISTEMDFNPLFMPGKPSAIPELQTISRSKTLAEMKSLQDKDGNDYSPTFDDSPYFFNSLRLRALPHFMSHFGLDNGVAAILFLFAFMLAALLLVITTIAIPAWMAYRQTSGSTSAPIGGIVYFISIGLGFICVEMAMMQRLSIFLGQPVYSMVVVLGGLILATGIGSLLSDRWPSKFAWQCRIPTAVAALFLLLYLSVVLPVTHSFTAALLWQRVLICLLLIFPNGLVLGFCFPLGLRWMKALNQERNLPWMWALNGAAGTLGTFVAMLISMETSIGTCILTGVTFYLLATVAVPRHVQLSTPHIP